jgi:iron(III) transport system substrate-binding protein
MTRKPAPLARLLLAILLVSACGGERAPGAPGAADSAGGVLTVYSGRNEKLIEPLIERFRRETGIAVRVRYGDTAELAATLMEEGGRTPAAVFIAQDAAALGALSDREVFRPLPEELLGMVPERFRSPKGDWVGLSGRARSVVYDPERISPAELPESLEAVGDPRYRGRFGLAPTNGSFQAHMAVYQAVHGREKLDKLLRAFAANQPRRYPKNSTIVEAVMSGEIEFGLVNHYYLWQAKKENPDTRVANFFMPEGEASSFVNVAGAGILSSGANAERFVAYLVSPDAQRYFATETFEYPLTEGAEPVAGLQPLDDIRTPDVSMGRVSDLLGDTLVLIQRSGLVQ